MKDIGLVGDGRWGLTPARDFAAVGARTDSLS
jgi:hypothetical protein